MIDISGDYQPLTRSLWLAVGAALANLVSLSQLWFVATFQLDPNFGRILAAYGGVFVAGSQGWAMIVDRFRPDRPQDRSTDPQGGVPFCRDEHSVRVLGGTPQDQ